MPTSSNTFSNLSNCPCNSGLSYQQCCEPLHQGKQIAASAEALMRSRFCAFYLLRFSTTSKTIYHYLIDSWHSTQYDDRATEIAALQRSATQQHWHSLQVIKKHQDSVNSAAADVEFVAFFAANNEAAVQQLHERSHFVKEDGHWFYVNGDFLPPIKLQRNDLCWCGSGKKLKKCHAL